MSRPIYETQADRDNEKAVIEKWDSKFNCESKKLPHRYCLDFCCIRNNEIVAVAEVKRRRKSSTHPVIEVAALKRMEALKLSAYLDVPAFLIFELQDGIFYINFDVEPKRHAWGGRFKTARDDQDQEPMVIWDTAELKAL